MHICDGDLSHCKIVAQSVSKSITIDNEIKLSFAKGILVERKGFKICWVAFAIEV
jgi:hypothetical protein